jgi:hypothetical protein
MITTHRDMIFELNAAASAIEKSGQNTMRAHTLRTAAKRLEEQDLKIGELVVALREVRLLLREMISNPNDNWRAQVEEQIGKITRFFVKEPNHAKE